MDGGSRQSDFLQKRRKTRVMARILEPPDWVHERQFQAVVVLVSRLISLVQVSESLVSVTQREAEVRHYCIVWEALLFYRLLRAGQNLLCFAGDRTDKLFGKCSSEENRAGLAWESVGPWDCSHGPIRLLTSYASGQPDAHKKRV